MSLNGFMIAAPASGSGKTTLTLGILRALKKRGLQPVPAKAGPDFIDPAFHCVAGGVECVNLDPWGMRKETISHLAHQQTNTVNSDCCFIVEAMMGLFDGGADGSGSAADLALQLGLPIVLVVDAAKQSHSIAALVSGFKNFRPALPFAGVILNKVGSLRHETLLREALGAVGVQVFGCVYRDENLKLPSRHLGLVQATEHEGLEGFIEYASEIVDKSVNVEGLAKLECAAIKGTTPKLLPPLGQCIAIAQDKAFAFSYPHILNGWCQQGAELTFFSPLNNEAPDSAADAVYLPGGYPELHGGLLASNGAFLQGLRAAAANRAFVYGECGGFMVLGDGLIDAQGVRHEMAGLLPLVTSFEKRKLNLGYRIAKPLVELPFLQKGQSIKAHEFHYSTIVEADVAPTGCDALFEAKDARGELLSPCGLQRGNVAGSYLHIIDLC